ncbi:MAG: twin-arginine translocase TatA/TatE family subunit [Gemmatimonadota bacterium]|nr:MAG: twin-arginine translocase TatA/TatE family subunit [Gemmatimonadota bacterium]
MQYFAVAVIGIGNMGWPEIVLIAILVMLLFGARRLPEIGQSLGKGIREFKKSLTSADEEPQIGSGEGDAARVEKKEETTS